MPSFEYWTPGFKGKVERANAILSPVLDGIEAGVRPKNWRGDVINSGVGSVGERWCLGRGLCAKMVEERSGDNYLAVAFPWTLRESVRVRVPGLNWEEDLRTWSRIRVIADRPACATSDQMRMEADAFMTAARIALFRGQRTAAREMLREAGVIYLSRLKFERSVITESLSQAKVIADSSPLTGTHACEDVA